MILKFFKARRGIAILIVAIVVCFAVVLSIVVKHRVQIAMLAPKNTMVNEERLNKDIKTILSLYGLKSSEADIVVDVSHSNYKNHCGEGNEGKGLCIEADPIIYGSSRNYTEIETFMEIWLYIMDHSFEYEIDGIVYYFTAPVLDSIFCPLPANEIYMSTEEFCKFYDRLNIDNLSHPDKVERLAEVYIEETDYKRRSGHIQVR